MKRIFSIVFILTLHLSAQSIFQSDSRSLFVGPKLDVGSSLDLNKIPTQTRFNYSINADEYYVGSGDIFLIKVDRKGPTLKIFNSPVTPAGYIALPDIAGIYVRGKILTEVKKDIVSVLKKKYPDAVVETYLFGLHSINITVLALDKINSKMILNSSNRLFDVYSYLEESLQMDSTGHTLMDRLSLRDVKIVRKNQTTLYDLREFKISYSTDLNPYLQHEDIVYFSFKDSTAHHISVKGAVTNPTSFQFKTGDDLTKALAFSGGVTPNADLNRLIVSRFYENSKIKNITLAFPRDSSFQLEPDDRIYVRTKKQYHIKSSVEIIGEVAFPGEYSIEDGKMRLKGLIELAGGFTEKASLSQAKVLRGEGNYVDKEFERLDVPFMRGMNLIERSYYQLKNREDPRLVNCEFEKLFNEHDESQNILIQAGDIILIPKSSPNIYVSGGVFNPGKVQYQKGWNFEDYIESVGGYSQRAKEGSVKIIRRRTGKWIDAEEEVFLEENDIIFVPMRDEISLYGILREGLAISAQLGTLVLIFLSLK